MQAAGGRRHPGGRPPAPPFLNPFRYRLRVGPGLAAQPRGLAGQRLARLPLGRAWQVFAPPTFGKERNVPLSPTLALRLSAHLKVFPAAR